MNKYYTYLIGWSKLNKFYYGVQYGSKANPDNLWKTYFTSSKYVHKFVEENGEPDIIQIRKTFSCPHKAREWENTVLRRMNAISNDIFINMSNNNSFKGIVMTDDIKKKISERTTEYHSKHKTIHITDGVTQKTLVDTDEIPEGWRRGMSDDNLENLRKIDHNYWNTYDEETKKEIGRKISSATKGVKKPEGHGANVSKALTGIKRPNQIGENNVSNRPEVREKISKSWETRVIGVWYTNEIENFYIKPGDYIDPAWRRGIKKAEKLWYTNGILNFFLFPDDPKAKTLYRGKTKAKTNKGEKFAGWFNDGSKQMKYKNEADVPIGWVRGMLPRNNNE